MPQQGIVLPKCLGSEDDPGCGGDLKILVPPSRPSASECYCPVCHRSYGMTEESVAAARALGLLNK